jgi:predicted dehydrogenase
MGNSRRNATDSGSPAPLIAGLVGLGPRGEDLLRASASAGIEVKWLCDESPQQLARANRTLPGCARTDRAELLLQDTELDAILIASPSPLQADLARGALEAGKHTFIEESPDLGGSALSALERLGRHKGLALACGNCFLHSSPVRAIKDILDDGRIGELFFVSSTRIDTVGASAAGERGRGHLAMLLHWLGERPQAVRASLAAGGAGGGEITVLTLAFPSGLAANVELGEREGSPMGRTVLVGSERMAVYDESEDQAVSTVDHGVVHRGTEDVADYRVSYRIGDVVPVGPGGREPLERALADFAAAISGDGDVLASTRLAKDAIRVVEAGRESLRRGSAEVAVGGPRRLLRVQARRRAAIG